MSLSENSDSLVTRKYGGHLRKYTGGLTSGCHYRMEGAGMPVVCFCGHASSEQ